MTRLKLTSATMAFITFSTFGVGCGGPADEGTPRTSTTQQQAQRGQELYKGMIFGIGPAAHYFDDVWERPEIKSRVEGADLQAKRELAAERMVTKISEMDPTFFDRFSNDLRSGNHLVIDQLLTDTKKMTQDAANALRKEAGLPEDMDLSDTRNAQAGTWFYVETVVAAAIAAVVAVVVTQFDATPLVGDGQVTRLHRDTWVDLLANKRFEAQ